MKKEKKTAVRPAHAARAIAWIPAFLLTGTLLLLVLSLIASQVLLSRSFYEKAALDPAVLRHEKETVDAEIREMAVTYEFEAESVTSLMDLSMYSEYSRQMIDWWLGQNESGKGEEPPRADLDAIHSVLEEEAQAELAADYSAADLVTSRIRDRFSRTVFPIRTPLIRALSQAMGKRADMPQITDAIRKLPLLAGAVCLLLSGLVALLLSRRLKETLKYFGTALSGAGIVLIVVRFLIDRFDMESLILEANEGLVLRYTILAGTVHRELVIAAAALLVLGAVCLTCFTLGGKQKREEAEV